MIPRSQGYFRVWFPWLFLYVICIERAPPKDLELVGGFKQFLFSIIYGMSFHWRSPSFFKMVIITPPSSIPSCVSRMLVPSCFPRFPTFLSSLRKKTNDRTLHRGCRLSPVLAQQTLCAPKTTAAADVGELKVVDLTNKCSFNHA